MRTEHGTRHDGRPSRRALARGLAWSVPAVAVGLPAPARAASGSGGSGGVTASCGPGRQGTVRLDVSGSSSPSVQVLFAHSGSGSFTVSVPSHWVAASGATYLVPVVGGVAQGTATVTFTIGQNGTATVSASVAATSGQPVDGTTVASITKHREGNSANYTCSST